MHSSKLRNLLGLAVQLPTLLVGLNAFRTANVPLARGHIVFRASVVRPSAESAAWSGVRRHSQVINVNRPSEPNSALSPRDGPRVQRELAALEARINAILPPRYVGCFEEVPASSMGSATLKYDQEGKVAWGAIWTTFCHLALAGGPPHRGRFLGAVPAAEASAHPAEQAAVVAEMKRAIRLSTNLPTLDDDTPGWVGIRCHDEDMAAWLVRAIVAENVIARHEENLLYVPTGPRFQVEKEVKSVVVSVAKSCHYLLDHIEPEDRPRGFSPHLIQPPLPEEIAAAPTEYRAVSEALRESISRLPGVPTVESKSAGWLGIRCVSEEMAIWMQRAIVVEDILARREHDVLHVPICLGDNHANSNDSTRHSLAEAHRLWHAKAAAG